MIVLPLFWDQYDNAQRVDELGFGGRLDTYRFGDAQLRDAVDRLVADSEPRGKLAAAGAEIRARDGAGQAAAAIERVGGAGHG
jgi:UDP:flavonoid glycosyltransferase YjiC (YdhE family)